MKKLILTVVIIIFLCFSVSGKPISRGIVKHTFMPEGQWFTGGNLSYLEASGDDFRVLMIDNLRGRSYTGSARALVGYTFRNDVAAGVALSYNRTMVKLDDVNIKLSDDMTFQIKDYYSLQHIYTASAFLRTYINIGNSKRFGLYNDIRFNMGGGQGKILRGTGEVLKGTYEKISNIGLTLAPGVSVFATDFMAIEASVGVLGIGYTRTEQITNQVYQGSFETFTADFRFNLLSIALGITFYF